MDYFFFDNILIVDDDYDFREILTGKVKEFTNNIYYASNGVEALEIIKANPIHLALVDINMPFMDGLTLLKEIKNNDLNVPTIILSGYGDKENLKAAISLGVYDFIEKPFSGEVFKNALRRSFDHINSIRIQQELLELLLYDYTQIPPRQFHTFSQKQKQDVLKSLLGIIKLKLVKREKKL